MHRIVRQVKREQHGPFHHIASCHADAVFVAEFAALYPTLPVFANARCGLWCVPDPKGVCHFKSTDGHFSNWSFSTKRLNLGVALAAAAHGGAVLVDATGPGKPLPDSFQKTVPIWCCVINRALRDVCGKGAAGLATPQAASEQVSDNAGAIAMADEAAGWEAMPAWPETVQLDLAGMPWVARPENESLGWDCRLHLPPWITDNERNSVESLLNGFVASLLSCGADLRELGAALAKPLRPLWVTPGSRVFTNMVPSSNELPFTPIFLVNASESGAPVHRREVLVPGLPAEAGPSRRVGFWYVPGAGDDEETWSLGLTPEVMWDPAHLRELLAAGPSGVAATIARLRGAARKDAPVPGDRGMPEGAAPEVKSAVGRPERDAGSAALPSSTMKRDAAVTPPVCDGSSPSVRLDRLPPKAMWGLMPLHGAVGTKLGLFPIHGTGISIGPAGCLRAGGVLFEEVDVVVSLCEHQLEATATDPCPRCQPGGSQGCCCRPEHVCLGPTPWDMHRLALAGRMPGAQGPRGEGGTGRTGWMGHGDSCCAWARHGELRYLWRAVPPAAKDRFGLTRVLGEVLEIVSHVLSSNRTVLLASDENLDAAACAAVALLVGCYGESGPQALHAGPLGAVQPSAQPVTRQAVDAAVRWVCERCPLARPSKARLKAVTSFFSPPRWAH